MLMDSDTRKLICETVIAEASGYYKLIVATATLFLGGTLVFWEKVAPLPSKVSLILLGLGWLFLIISVMLIAFVRRDNVEAGRLCLSDKFDKYERVAKRSRNLTTWSGMSLALGMFFVASAGMATLWEKTMKMEIKTVAGTAETKSIPFKEIAGGGGGGSGKPGSSGSSTTQQTSGKGDSGKK